MAWLKLTTTAQSPHRVMLIKAFPVDVKECAANAQWSKNDWARGLEERYLPDGDVPVAWLEAISGNLVLVEVVGAEEREGVVQARLWVQASQATVDLLGGKIVRYGNRSRTRSQAVASVVALVVAIAALDLPAEPVPEVDAIDTID
ncbi:hypothetical protein [Microbacterium terricola]|uniref:Uncharacterized protein n=1 Tax=Microbacterium terricola TaxID=344163 RepID=A0ABM8E0H3_9MICO|nr:hypothetical protein [Microbacterium terricola]UYK40993.1 hypothetical protein OAU46_04940 [Microbacterium terricola]BDV31250.1 hypothetical protein Microterr_19100 [Microbacterium terricola]